MLTWDAPKTKKKTSIRSIAVLTSGGDAPGMNAAVRAVVRYGIYKKKKVFGIYRGYQGLIEGDIVPLIESSVANIIQRGGTFLKTSRCPSFHNKATRKQAVQILKDHEIDALVIVGGDGSFRGAHLLEKETGYPTIGVPGTIDNDIALSEDTIGFDTAVNTAIESIDRIRDTASSHERLFLVEVMGRNSSFIAIQTGIGGGSETVFAPGRKLTVDNICSAIERGVKRGKTSSIVVVAEGPKAGTTTSLASTLKKRGFDPKVCILGHVQRGGRPTAHDRLLASTLGAASIDCLIRGYSNGMIGVQNNRATFVPFQKIHQKKKAFPEQPYQLAESLAI